MAMREAATGAGMPCSRRLALGALLVALDGPIATVDPAG
jgi:hypothetical protein